jgi:hypothetical protein
MYASTACLIAYLLYDWWSENQVELSQPLIGYSLSLVGALVVLATGFADLLWHLIFGVEKIGLSSQLSPPHAIMVFVGSALIGFGVITQKWFVQDNMSREDKVIAALMATFVVGMMRYLMQTFAPTGNMSTGPSVELVLSLAIQTGLTIWMLTLVLFYQDLPIGTTFTYLLITHVGTPIIFEEYYWLSYIVVGSVIGEALYHVIHPRQSTLRYRCFSAAIPSVLTLGYFATLWTYHPVDWPVHVWTGTILLTGYIGLLLSFLCLKPFSQRFVEPDT